MSTRKTTLFYTVLVAIASVAIGMVIASRLDLSPSSTAQSLAAAPPANSTPITGNLDATTFRAIAAEMSPAVVNIRTESTPRTEELTEFFGGDELFRRFFGDRVPEGGQRRPSQRPPSVGAGTGFIIDAEQGLILTNNHVVENTTKIEVGFFGDAADETYEAKVVGRDPLTDSALIQLDEKPTRELTAVRFGDSDQIQPGDWVVAIGNPFNFNHTVTVGVVSALGRPFPVAPQRTVEMLQTDAAINPGNSGGPMLNIRGEVVGINTAILSDRGMASNMGIGFAVPINAVRELIPQLRTGKVTRGMIGVQTGDGNNGVTMLNATGGQGFSGLIICSANIPDKIAIAVDTQMDDGVSATGTVRSLIQTAPNPAIGTGQVATAAYAETGSNVYTMCRAL